jgi:hypothetical protein
MVPSSCCALPSLSLGDLGVAPDDHFARVSALRSSREAPTAHQSDRAAYEPYLGFFRNLTPWRCPLRFFLQGCPLEKVSSGQHLDD